MSSYRNRSAGWKAGSSNMAEGERQSAAERAVGRFSTMMIDRLKVMKASDWKQGWIDGNCKAQGLPQNIDGRTYSGTNSFFLQMDTAMHHYKAPVYMTFLNIQKEGAHVNKGEASMPVIYWDLSIRDREGHRVSLADFRAMSAARQQEMEVHPFLRAYNVFNISQTNLEEANKEKYDKVMARFEGRQLRDDKGMYENPALDRMFARQEWICPIQVDKVESGARYSFSQDKVFVPMKVQFNISSTPEGRFKDGMEYYSSALHEMAHSTGTPDRLNRTVGKKFGDARYAKEELVAELTAALVGNAMGFDKRILDNNAAYVDGWLDALREEPQFIVSVMADVNRASRMIMEKVDVQLLALGEAPLLAQDSKQTAKFQGLSHGTPDVKAAKAVPGNVDTLHVTDGSIFKKRDGSYAIRAFYEGQSLGVKPLGREAAEQYLAMAEGPLKDRTLHAILDAKYSLDASRRGIEHGRGLGI